MWILRVNMNDQSYRVEPLPEAFKNLAGRALTSTIIANEVPALCHPLGINNKIVFSPGIVTGTSAPTSARISVGAKSPLTGGIKESNAGSAWGADLADLNIRALILEGQPEENGHYWGMHISYNKKSAKPKVKFFDATRYANQPLAKVFPKLYTRFGKSVSIGGCGLAGERGYANSGVVFNDLAGRATRYAGRGGMGAVLGSKRVKFIVLDCKGAPGVKLENPQVFERGRRKVIDAIQTHDLTKDKGALNTYGTAVLINILNEAGGLPTRNFSDGRFEGAAKIAGEAIFEGNKQRLGKELYNHACSPGCIIQCSNTWFKEDGSEHASCVEYESDWDWVPIAGSITWTRSPRWSGCATIMAWTQSKPAPHWR